MRALHHTALSHAAAHLAFLAFLTMGQTGHQGLLIVRRLNATLDFLQTRQYVSLAFLEHFMPHLLLVAALHFLSLPLSTSGHVAGLTLRQCGHGGHAQGA